MPSALMFLQPRQAQQVALRSRKRPSSEQEAVHAINVSSPSVY